MVGFRDHLSYRSQQPATDRTSPTDGMFMYTDFTQLGSGTQTMTLNSEYVTPSGPSCFTFYLYVMNFDNNSNNNKFTIDIIDQTGKLSIYT